MFDIEQLQAWLIGSVLGMPRILVTFSLLPFFNSQNSSPFMRVAVSTAFMLPALPMIVHQVSAEPVGGSLLLVLVLKEGVIGAVIGFTLAVPFWVAESIGSVISIQSGATNISETNSLTGNSASPLGNILAQGYVVLFMLLGGVDLVLDLIYRTYSLWPINAPIPHFEAGFVPYYLSVLDTLMRSSIILAAPALIAMLMAELGLAIASMFAPQMQVFFLAMSVKGGIALFVLAVYSTNLFHYLGQSVFAIPSIVDMLHAVMR